MTTIHVTRDNTGKLVGLGEKDKKAYAAFVKRVHELETGEVYTLDVWFPRNPKLHGLHFAMLSAVFDAQEQFATPDQLRAWLQVGAGHCEFVPGPTGKMVAIPKSIAHHKLDDVEFSEHHEKVKEFLRSPYAKQFLWPHLPESEQDEMVESILTQFERSQ